MQNLQSDLMTCHGFSSTAVQDYCIYLDCDGVLHDEVCNQIIPCRIDDVVFKVFGGERSHSATCQRCITCMKAKALLLDKTAIKNFEILANKIAKKVNLHIIISSTWREGFTASELKEIFKPYEFSQYIAGRTVDPDSPFSEWKDYCKLPHIELTQLNFLRHIATLEQHGTQEEELDKFVDKHDECRASQIRRWEEQDIINKPNYLGLLILDDRDNHLSENFEKDFISTDHGIKRILTREDVKKAYARFLEHLEGQDIAISASEQNLDVEFAKVDAELNAANLLRIQNEPFKLNPLPWATF